MRRKILIVSRHLPSSATSGSRHRLRQHEQVLSRAHDVRVFTIRIGTAAGGDAAGHLREERVRFGVLRLLRRGLDVLRNPRRLGLDAFYDERIERRLDEEIRAFRPDTVIFGEIWLHRYLPVAERHGCRIVLDMHCIEVPLYQSIVDADIRPMANLRARVLLAASREAEGDFARRAHARWVCSEHDRRQLLSLYGRDAVIVPNAVDVKGYARGTHDDARTLLFMGTYAYEPNEDAAKRLLTRIFPRVAEAVPDAALALVGGGLTRRMRRMAGRNPRITAPGHVPDIRPFLAAATVLAAPISRGGGTKLKIIEAMASGKPVVTTPKGAEGLHLTDGVNAVIRETDEELAAETVRLLQDQALRRRIGEAGLRTAHERFSWESVAPALERGLEAAAG